MKKFAIFFVLGLSFLVYGCGNTQLIFTKKDFLRTFNVRMEEEKLEHYKLETLDMVNKTMPIVLIGANKSQDLQISLSFDKSEVLIKFGLLTANISEQDLNKIIKIIKESFPNSKKYVIKEGVSIDTGYKGIAYFLKVE